LEDYFRYEVLYHINITDIDDKIILRARHNKLLADFQAAHGTDYAAVLDKVTEALDAKRAKLDKKLKALEQPLPAGTPSRDVEAHETEKKATALKRNQFDAVAAAIEVVKSVAEGGAAGVSTIVAQLSATVGCEVGGRFTHTLTARPPCRLELFLPV
jgi:cysteinyl-tRNA synthetase